MTQRRRGLRSVTVEEARAGGRCCGTGPVLVALSLEVEVEVASVAMDLPEVASVLNSLPVTAWVHENSTPVNIDGSTFYDLTAPLA